MKDGETIDWWSEDTAERERWRHIMSGRGLRGVVAPFWDASKVWFVVIFTGIGVGVAGGWLDVLVQWCATDEGDPVYMCADSVIGSAT